MNSENLTAAYADGVAVGLVNVVLGTYIVPTLEVATEKGTAAGCYLIWAVIASLRFPRSPSVVSWWRPASEKFRKRR